MASNTMAGFRLSTQQERVWAQQQIGHGARFRAQCAVLIEGPLLVSKLQEALRAVVERHEILRTVFHRQAGLKVPFQVILESGEPAWNILDLSGSGEATQNQTIEKLFLSETEFNLERGPVLQASLAILAPEKHVLVLRLPALSADSPSLRKLVAEIGETYAASFNGGKLDGDVMQYADVVQWQNELLESEDTKAGRDFWREHCRKLDLASLGSTALPLEARTDAAKFSPETLASVVDPNPLAHLDSLTRQHNTSVAEFLLACWNILLWRLTGQPAVTTGFEFDGRKYEELEDALGLFAKYVPLQTSIEPELSFIEILRQVSSAIAEAHQWQESFAWSQIESSADSGGPMLPVTFDYAELGGKQQYGDLWFRVQEQRVCSDRFKLKLSAVRNDSGLTLEFHYDAARFDRDAMERLASYFQTLLAAALDQPETPVSRLPLLNPAQRQQLLVEWNQTAAAYADDQCLHQRFEAQAARTPERPALRFQEQQLSYRELNQQANRLAHYLRSLGVGPGGLVGLAVERSAEMMVAVLAILKAGGAYVPLNPDNPKPRLAQQTAGMVALITQQKLLGQMPEFAGKTLCLDRDQALWNKQPESNPRVETTPENLVYVIYTSGSTGVPKGVAVRHRNLVNYTEFITRRLQLEKYPEGLHFATVSTLGADLGNTCIYPALVSGGCLHVIAYEVSTDATRMAAYTAQQPIDVLKIVPSHLQALLQGAEAKHVLPRKYLITGGETLTAQLIERVEQLGAACDILNHYGPTETTVGSLTLRLNEYDRKHSPAASIPIGRPIANTQVYILDSNLQPVPVGVVGELYIAGAGVTAGYLNQAERTAERFVPNPFVSDTNAKMYRSGDLARWGADGNVEFLGRGDDQVKIRGFRIELGEIEAVLTQHASVKQAVVLAKADERGEKRLLAYVVANREPATSSDDLRAYLKQQLPDYMVPTAVVLLAKLPLTANGKIDRQALPAPEAVASKEYVAPRTPTEEVVAGIWAEVLRLERVSTQDNFFDLGGHSLLATQVVSRVRRTLNIDLPLRTLFESPTVAKIAEQIEKARRGRDGLVPPITRVSRDQAIPLSFAQQRLWVLDQIEPNSPLYNIPRTLRMQGRLNVGALQQALNEIVRRHDSQRTAFAVRDGNPVQVIAPTLTLSLPVSDLTHLPEAERESEARRLAAQEAVTPFNLSTGPLVRAALLQLAPEDHILLLTMHHIVSDAWSAGVFLQELSELYEAFSSGRRSPLPELTIQYADYAAWQRQWFQGEVLGNQLAYWREQLKGAPPLLQLPTDRPRPQTQSFRGAYESIPLAAEVSSALKKFSQQEGMTLFMTLLAGFQTLLSRYSGQEQIVLGTDVANRTTTETERLIGFFINLLALRGDLSGNPTFRELLGRVRESALGAYAHQDMPFDKLVEELQPERSLSHNPIVQALFVMQNIPRQKRDLAGLKLTPFEMPITRSKFDLAVFMVESESGLVGNWLYSTDLFERATILRMASNFETLLRSAVSQPDARISTLEMLTEEEKQQRGAEKKQRKQSQLKKLITLEPKAVSLPEADPSKK